MVRLVFRPYTQVRRTICTSVALRTFIRVSPEFVLLKHSSPSFGSLCMCSNSNPLNWSVGCWCTFPNCQFHCAQKHTHTSLHMHQTPWSVFQDGSYETGNSSSHHAHPHAISGECLLATAAGCTSMHYSRLSINDQ